MDFFNPPNIYLGMKTDKKGLKTDKCLFCALILAWSHSEMTLEAGAEVREGAESGEERDLG